MIKTKYPIYIPSLSRVGSVTAKLLTKHNIPFRLVVEKHEYSNYTKVWGKDKVLALPGSLYGSVSFARNWIKAHARKAGYKKHWQLDDDISNIAEQCVGKRLHCNVAEILQRIEQWAALYSNVGLIGLTANNFLKSKPYPYKVNGFAYTCVLVSDNKLKWVDNTEEDLEYNLQLLHKDLRTVTFSKFFFYFRTTGLYPGGYTELNANNQRLQRQHNTIKLWPLLELANKKFTDGHYLNANKYWQQFKHNTTLIK